MKKHLLGLFAILLAIGFSAFTVIQKPQKPAGTAYYWYQVVGTQTSGSKLNSTPVDKAAAMSSLTPCNDAIPENCLFGSTNANLASGSSIGSPASDRLIKKN